MKVIPQHDQMDCGPACLAMVTAHYGKHFGLQYFRDRSFLSREGVSLLGIKEAAGKIGMDPAAVRMKVQSLNNSLLPCILHWNQNHFVVLHRISTRFFSGDLRYHVIDPGHGKLSLPRNKFMQDWLGDQERGIALLLKPTPAFYAQVPPAASQVTMKYLVQFLSPHKSAIIRLCVLLLLSTLTTLVFPILTQRLIDEGVAKKDMQMITYILLAQLAFFLGNITFSIFRNWITLTIGTLINIQIISDFLKKLLKLPIKFFDTKLRGDFSQRIADHERIENFLTSQSLLTLFSAISFSVFFAYLWYYDLRILAVYIILTTVSIFWTLFWLSKRQMLDYFRFQQRSQNQEAIYEMINGVSEMKLNHFEDYKRSEWEAIQHKLFNINIRILKLDQLQLSGFECINQLKNILVTFLTAMFVVQGKLTFGALLSVSFIIGQMNAPISQLIAFFRSLQDAKLSLARLHEVQEHEEEEQPGQLSIFAAQGSTLHTPLRGNHTGIDLQDVSFQYEGPKSPYIFKNISLYIPAGKVTAIVGASGSGKTTLMKILLKFYAPVSGEIFFNDTNLQGISPSDLRAHCGVVMQDGYIFGDTILRNIVCGVSEIDDRRLDYAVKVANISDFLNALPLGLNTKIGASGNGISGGQKQRILIARAVYKDPHYLFFDEATSALDAENERIIHDNLQTFFSGKTVLIIAHRLSTVKNADQIIVLKQGRIVELGNHQELVACKSEYYHLVKNQLELGT